MEHFVIEFISLNGVPQPATKSKVEVYLRAYLSAHVGRNSLQGNMIFSYQQIGAEIQLPKKPEGRIIVWRCFRDFLVFAPSESVLTVETCMSSGDLKNDAVVGKVEISVKDLFDEDERTFTCEQLDPMLKPRNMTYSLTLRRCYVNRPVPMQRTIFLIRHGESKWNQAQASFSLPGLLDRDHALTSEGVKQAAVLRDRWNLASMEKDLTTDVEEMVAALKASHSADDEADPLNKFTPNDFKLCENALLPTYEHMLDTTEDVRRSISDAIPMPNHAGIFHSPTAPAALGLLQLQDSESELNVSPRNRRLSETKSPRRISMVEQIQKIQNEQRNSLFEFNPVGTPVKSAVVDDEEKMDIWEEQYISKRKSRRKSINLLLEYHNSVGSPKPKPSSLEPTQETSESEKSRHVQFSEGDNREVVLHQLAASSSEKIENINERSISIENENVNLESNFEALERRRSQYSDLFLRADAAYSSPLTRAIETAYVALEGHPALQLNPLTLFSSMREVKRMGGMDTVGVYFGETIAPRVFLELAKVLGESRAAELTEGKKGDSAKNPSTDSVCKHSPLPLDVGDAQQPWWNNLSSFETEIQQQQRVKEFITFARFNSAKTPIFVGHSLFFKAFVSKRLTDKIKQSRPMLSSHLETHRLSNASLLAVTVEFLDFVDVSIGGGLSECNILDADLVYGGGFHGLEEDLSSNYRAITPTNTEKYETSPPASKPKLERPKTTGNMQSQIASFGKSGFNLLSFSRIKVVEQEKDS